MGETGNFWAQKEHWSFLKICSVVYSIILPDDSLDNYSNF